MKRKYLWLKYPFYYIALISLFLLSSAFLESVSKTFLYSMIVGHNICNILIYLLTSMFFAYNILNVSDRKEALIDFLVFSLPPIIVLILISVTPGIFGKYLEVLIKQFYFFFIMIGSTSVELIYYNKNSKTK